MRYVETHRIGKRGPVVARFVGDDLKRRTVAVPFARSDDELLDLLVEHVNQYVPMRPSVPLDDGRG